MSKPEDELVIGIDLGTTNSVVAVHHFGRSEVIANDLGARTTPSIVYLGPTPQETLVGAPAKQMSANNPQCTVFGAKRMLGRRFNDSIIQDDIKLWPYTVIPDPNSSKADTLGGGGMPVIEIEHDGVKKLYTPEEVSGVILAKLKKVAEDFLGTTITKAVITVPANFNSLQRNSTRVAAQHAGLTVSRILNEPTAAAFAYGYQAMERGKDKEHILIYDFGGGTLDVSIVVSHNGVFQVLGSDGDTHLGGEDFDNALVDYCLQQFQKQTGLDPRGNSRVLRKLRAECEKAKCSLSALTKTFVEVSFKGEEVVLEISRALFERIAKSPLERCIAPVQSLLTRLRLADSDIDEIILVGGTTRIPKIQANIINSFPKFRTEQKTLCKTVNADEVVAVGASLQAAVLSKSSFQETKGIEISDVIPLSLGLKTLDGQFLPILTRNAVLPASNFVEVALNQLHIINKHYLVLLEGEDDDISNAYSLDLINISRILSTNKNAALALRIRFQVDDHGNLSLSVLPARNNTDTNGIYAYFNGSKLVYHKYGDQRNTQDPDAHTQTTPPLTPLKVDPQTSHDDDDIFGDMLSYSITPNASGTVNRSQSTTQQTHSRQHSFESFHPVDGDELFFSITDSDPITHSIPEHSLPATSVSVPVPAQVPGPGPGLVPTQPTVQIPPSTLAPVTTPTPIRNQTIPHSPTSTFTFPAATDDPSRRSGSFNVSFSTQTQPKQPQPQPQTQPNLQSQQPIPKPVTTQTTTQVTTKINLDDMDDLLDDLLFADSPLSPTTPIVPSTTTIPAPLPVSPVPKPTHDPVQPQPQPQPQPQYQPQQPSQQQPSQPQQQYQQTQYQQPQSHYQPPQQQPPLNADFDDDFGLDDLDDLYETISSKPHQQTQTQTQQTQTNLNHSPYQSTQGAVQYPQQPQQPQYQQPPYAYASPTSPHQHHQQMNQSTYQYNPAQSGYQQLYVPPNPPPQYHHQPAQNQSQSLANLYQSQPPQAQPQANLYQSMPQPQPQPQSQSQQQPSTGLFQSVSNPKKKDKKPKGPPPPAMAWQSQGR